MEVIWDGSLENEILLSEKERERSYKLKGRQWGGGWKQTKVSPVYWTREAIELWESWQSWSGIEVEKADSANKGIVEQGLCSRRVKPDLQVWDQGDGDNKHR